MLLMIRMNILYISKKLYFLLNIVHAVQNAIEAFTTNASVRDK